MKFELRNIKGRAAGRSNKYKEVGGPAVNRESLYLYEGWFVIDLALIHECAWE